MGDGDAFCNDVGVIRDGFICYGSGVIALDALNSIDVVVIQTGSKVGIGVRNEDCLI